MNQDKLVIAIIEGTSREARESIQAARFVEQVGKTYQNVEIIFVDPQEFTFPNNGADTEGKDPRYTDITARADGFFIVSPEYNHSMPGALKRMLDSEYENYRRKPVALAGASSGQWGGTRMVEALLPVVRSLGLVPMQPTNYFPYVQDLFDDEGSMLPEHVQQYTKAVRYNWDELLWYAAALKAARQQS
jgi:NAD(P)H-dependent FMN reductase